MFKRLVLNDEFNLRDFRLNNWTNSSWSENSKVCSKWKRQEGILIKWHRFYSVLTKKEDIITKKHNKMKLDAFWEKRWRRDSKCLVCGCLLFVKQMRKCWFSHFLFASETFSRINHHEGVTFSSECALKTRKKKPAEIIK